VLHQRVIHIQRTQHSALHRMHSWSFAPDFGWASHSRLDHNKPMGCSASAAAAPQEV
jgi:hypothetical protein